MTKRRLLFLAIPLVAIVLSGIPAVVDWHAAAEQLPARLTDQEFWKLASEFSEPGGTFHSENLVSNEIRFQSIVPELSRTAISNRAYIGVGSEQNFTYIAAIHPAIAFIVDIRRGNLDLHLIYKVLFELSADRADFVSRLFSRAKPASLSPTSTAADIFAAFRKAVPSQLLYNQNLKTIKTALTAKHGFQLSAADLEAIDFIYGSWFRYGPDIRYQLTGAGGGPNLTYAALMTATDAEGRNRSYLATEETFRIVKDLHARNMIVPVVGNFGGPKALKAVGAYLKQWGIPVSAFYTSNVEQYLRRDGIWGNFCANTATMPIDGKSVFIRSARAGFSGQPAVIGAGDNFILQLTPMRSDLTTCSAAR